MTDNLRATLTFFSAKAFALCLHSGRSGLDTVAVDVISLAQSTWHSSERPSSPPQKDQQVDAVASMLSGLQERGQEGLTAAIENLYASIAAPVSIGTNSQAMPTANEPGDHVARTVLRCTAELLEIPVHTIRSDSKLMADLGADSLDLVELVMYIEDELRIEVSDEQAERVVTVQDAIDLARTMVG